MIEKILIIFSSFISIFSLIPNNSDIIINTTKEINEDYFINDMSESDYINKYTEPFNNFFNLNEKNYTNNTYCKLCKTGINIILDTIIQEYKWSYLHTFCSLVCSLALRRDICYAAVGRYGPIVIENTLKRLLDAETICSFFLYM